ncbi:unnamed protein product [Rhizoctonia solani]|uniref:Zn(2)-C6 fungal-type domain-containing protein n=1 Tax=Rhizoctonia solani TaxID=456999 RepID=A0A8H2XIT4_9AGAM|nr:unnamed protein product [Rhizoctonia solani]
MGLTKERSRKGCLPCLQKRKKCDEVKPTCIRCSQGDDQCVWRSLLPKPATKSRVSAISLQPGSRTIPTDLHYANAATPGSSITDLVQNTVRILDTRIEANPLAGLFGSDYDLAQSLFASTASHLTEPQTRMSILGRAEHTTDIDDFLDEDESEVIKFSEWGLEAVKVLSPYMPGTDQASWTGALNSYFMFSSRYVYESSKFLEATKALTANYIWSNSARLGLLGTVALLHSYINPMAPQSLLRERSKQFIDAATTSIEHEMAQPGMPVSASLAGISTILLYHYFSGNLSAYLKCVETAVPMIKALVGPKPVAFHCLRGLETIDIRSFAWCDIFTAIALSFPTRLVYDCDAKTLLSKNQDGPNPTDMDMEVGLEWMCGLPDALLMLIIQIINLRHSSFSQTERLVHAARIERALRDWKVWPSRTTNSVMKVRRMAAQEIWRYFTILYLYQAIHKASPSHEVVQRCVTQIFKLGLTLRPGHNPDCLLSVPYFVTGIFAISANHRQLFRSRLLGCGMGTYGQTLAKTLEELWQRSLDTGKHNDWTTKSPSIIIFS